MSNKTNVENQDEIVTLSVDIPYELKDKLKFNSYRDKKPIKDIVKEALEKYLNDH
jgi:predicted DNA-binding protein